MSRRIVGGDGMVGVRRRVEADGAIGQNLETNVEELGRYVLIGGELSLLSSFRGPAFLGIRAAVGAVVGQRSGLQLVGLRPWRIHHVTALNAVAVQSPAAPYALAGGAPSLEQGFGIEAAFDGSVTAGAAVLVGVGGFRIAAGQTIAWAHPIVIPAGAPVFFMAQADNTASDVSILISQPPNPAAAS